MKLTQQQIERFDRDGYLFFPGQFTPQETRLLTDAVPAIYARREVYNVRE
jgi:ectoine hydroxylase